MLSAVILIKNGELHLSKVLEALSQFPEVLLFDTGSEDRTLEIAKRYANVTCYSRPFKGFGPSHNEAASCATYDWILSIDSDEVLTPALSEEILSLELDPSAVYAIHRRNFFNGKEIKWCGWQHEFVFRLYNRKITHFSEALVHEKVLTKGLKKRTLHHSLHHYPYATISDFLKKMESYSSLFAEQHRHRKKSSPWIALLHGFAAFFRSYFLKRGFLGAYEGFLISAYNGHTAFYKYLKLYHANKRP